MKGAVCHTAEGRREAVRAFHIWLGDVALVGVRDPLAPARPGDARAPGMDRHNRLEAQVLRGEAEALVRTTGSVLLPAVLPDLTAAPAPAAGAEAPAGRTELEEYIRNRLAGGSEGLHEQTRREIDRVLLPLVMEHTRGNQFQAAKVLGVARQTLRRRLRELSITPRFTDATEDDAD